MLRLEKISAALAQAGLFGEPSFPESKTGMAIRGEQPFSRAVDPAKLLFGTSESRSLASYREESRATTLHHEMNMSAIERILVVEDDRAVQKALKRLFEAEGFGVE
ncbi:MAG: response regulator, partial [Acidobacteriota bacterium]|nr:response regulator [Acidobacteriota bacterium]